MVGAHGKFAYIVPETGTLRLMVHTPQPANLYLLDAHQTRNWESGVAPYVPVSSSEGDLKIHVLERAALSGATLYLIVVNRSSERLLVQHYASQSF